MNNSVLGKGKASILERFYHHRNKELYFSEILRETKLTPNTTLRHLRSLEGSNIIVSTKKIGNTFYRLNAKNPIQFSIFSFFDYSILNQLPHARKKAILDYISQLQHKPLIVVVFGSTANKTYAPGSDIDMMLVYNKKEIRNNKMRQNIAAITGINLQDFRISFEYFAEQVIKQDDPVITHAIKSGFVVLGHFYFYRELVRWSQGHTGIYGSVTKT